MDLINKHVLLLIGGHFSLAPRAQKEASALANVGTKVSIRGMWWDDTLAQEDEQIARSIGVDFRPLVDLRNRNWASYIFRLQGKLARTLFHYGKIPSARCIGPTAPEMLQEGKKLKPDLVIAHSEGALWAGKKLHEMSVKVGVDFEDWFSQDLPKEARRSRPSTELQLLERYHLKNAAFCFATTQSMAEALAFDAGTSRIPTLIPNCFPWNEVEDDERLYGDERGEEVSLYWYSQTIGPGRGLEVLGLALTKLSGNWKLRLRGNLKENDEWFLSTFPEIIRQRIEILPLVSNAELLTCHRSHDVGLALESPYCRSRDLTATNKIFDYLRAELAVLATDTMGQKEIASQSPDAIYLVSADDVDALASSLQDMIDNPDLISEMKRSARYAACTIWNWDTYQPKILELVKGVFDGY